MVKKKEVGSKRERVVKLRVTEAEYARMSEVANEAGLSLSALLRASVDRVKVANRDDAKKKIKELNLLNANMNMIAKWANIHKGAGDAVQVISSLIAIEREVGEMRK